MLNLSKRLILCLSVFFPALVYFGRDHISPQVLALVLVLLVVLRRTMAFGIRANYWLVASGLLLAVVAFRANDNLPLKLYPVLVNGALLTIFALSLRYPPPIAERVARLGWPDLPPRVAEYTRKVTQAWCVFFGANAAVALWTAVWQPDHVWFYYNGIIAYCLAGCMFAAEWCVRRRVLREVGWRGDRRAGAA
jgi:uncharacterized membrane protein